MSEESEDDQPDSRATYIYSHFKKLIDATDGKTKRRCLVVIGKKRDLSSLPSTDVLCNKLLKAKKSDSLGKHLRSHKIKSIIQTLTEYDKALKAERDKKASRNAIVLHPAQGPITQSLITSHFTQIPFDQLRDELSRAIAMMFAAHDLANNISRSDYVQAAFDLYAEAYRRGAVKKFDSRERIDEYQKKLAVEFKNEIFVQLRSSDLPVTLCYDGWRDTTGMHVQNVTALAMATSFLLKSDVSESGRSTAPVLFGMLSAVIKQLIENKVVVGAVVADNAAVNGAVARSMKVTYPWILPLPCAAHALQLCIVRLFDQDSFAESFKDIAKNIYSTIANSYPMLAEFRRVQGADVVNLHRPQKTRWNSYFQAFNSILRTRSAVVFVLGQFNHPLVYKLDSAFWSGLQVIVDFLTPFRDACHVIQSDHACLLDVFLRFDSLLKHISSAPDQLVHGAKIMRKAIRHHWTKHVHQQAVFMCAKFACEDTTSSLFSYDLKSSAPTWFIDWAARLWIHSHALQDQHMDVEGVEDIERVEGIKNRDDEELEEEEEEKVDDNSDLPEPVLSLDEIRFNAKLTAVKATISNQYDLFLGRMSPFHNIRKKIADRRPQKARTIGQTTAPFDVITEWRRLEDSAPEVVYGVIGLMSFNCSEASVERIFSMQKLTHSALKNRKKAATVECQMIVKVNARALLINGQKSVTASRSLPAPAPPVNQAIVEDDEDEVTSDTDIDLRDSGTEQDSEASDVEPADIRAVVASALPARAVPLARAAVPRVQPASQPARRSWTIVARLSPELDAFCKSYIIEHSLCLPTPFSKRGSVAALRRAMEADISLRREQPCDAQKHINFLLFEQRDQQQQQQ
jgi:hypothetical protein